MNIKDFQVFVRDSLQHVDAMKARHPDLPVFILGHSMVSRTLTHVAHAQKRGRAHTKRARAQTRTPTIRDVWIFISAAV